MDWLEEILKKYVTDEAKLKEFTEEVNKTFPLNAVPKKQYNDKVTELNYKTVELETASEKIKETTETLAGFATLEVESKEGKDKIAALEKDLTEYKDGESTRIAGVESAFQKQGALDRALRLAKANPEALDFLSEQFKMDDLTLGDDKKSFVAGFDSQIEAIKTAKPSFFLAEKIGESGTPPAGNPVEKESTKPYWK